MRRGEFASYCFLGLLLAYLYLSAALPGIYWGDDGYLITSSQNLTLGHPPGHPLYMLAQHWLRWVPFGDLAARCNLLSATFAVLAVIFWLRWGFGSVERPLVRWAGVLTACVLIVCSPVILHQAIRAETYAFQLFGLAIIFNLLSCRQKTKSVVSAAFIVGLFIGNHLLLTVLAVPGILFMAVFGKRSGFRWDRRLIYTLCAFGLGLSVLFYLPLRAYKPSPYSWSDFQSGDAIWGYATAQDYQNQFFSSGPQARFQDRLTHFFRYQAEEMGYGVIILAGLGIAGMYIQRRWTFTGLLAVAVCTVLVSAACNTFSMENWDFQGYLSVVTITLAISAGLCLTLLLYRVPSRNIQIAVLAAVVITGAFTVQAKWPPEPGSRWTAYLYGRMFLNSLEPDTLVFTRSDILYVLRYLQAWDGNRSDVDLLSLNQMNRFGSLSGVITRYPRLKIPDAADLGRNTLADIIIQSNTNRPVAWELAEDNRIAESMNLQLQTAFLGSPISCPQFSEELWRLFWRRDDVEHCNQDHNAVEQLFTILYNRGSYFLMTGDGWRAMGELKKAVRLDPSSARVWNNLGVALAAVGDVQKARECFETVLKINPLHPGAEKNLRILNQ